MSTSKRTSKPAAKAASQSNQKQQATSEPEQSSEPTTEQQAVGVALAGASIATPLLLALLDKALSFEEVQSVCRRATEIAGRFEHLPEGKFALACIDDFLLTRTPVDSKSPALVPADATEAAV
jgi:hypothetical protein